LRLGDRRCPSQPPYFEAEAAEAAEAAWAAEAAEAAWAAEAAEAAWAALEEPETELARLFTEMNRQHQGPQDSSKDHVPTVWWELEHSLKTF